MRTTIILDDDIASILRAEAERSGLPLKEVVNNALRAGLKTEVTPPPQPKYRLKPASMGAVAEGIDLDRVLELAVR